MCEPCNNELDRRFEKAAKPIFAGAKGRNADERWETLTANDVERLALWVLKIGLLLKHPASRWDEPVVDEKADRWDVAEPELYQWMRDGASPPEDLSVYASFTSRDVAANEKHLIHLPEHMLVGAEVLTNRATNFGILDLTFDVIHHPRRRLQHPLEPRGAVRIWPGGATGDDLQHLEPRNPDDCRILVDGQDELWPGADPYSLPPAGELGLMEFHPLIRMRSA